MTLQRRQPAVHRIERGDAEVFGLLTCAPVLMSLATLIAFAGIGRAAQLAVISAARECARVASAHLNPSGAVQAGQAAAFGALEGSSFYSARTSVSVSGHAGPGSEVTCVVRYRVSLGALPLAGWFGLGDVELHSDAGAMVERYKSR